MNHNFSAAQDETADDSTSDPAAMREIIRQFYQHLYTTSPVQGSDINNYINSINFNRMVNQNDNDILMLPITIDELVERVKRSPKQSSPGNDGLGYQYLNILFNIPLIKALILEVYNNALLKNSTPPSWKVIRVRLLPKKGDLADLKN
jgi:hypothetical protein